MINYRRKFHEVGTETKNLTRGVIATSINAASVTLIKEN